MKLLLEDGRADPAALLRFSPWRVYQTLDCEMLVSKLFFT